MQQPVTLIDRTLASRLKKQAKRLQRESRRPHHELLEDLAKQAGFENWHQLTIADDTTQALEARLAKSLVIILDIKESRDEEGEDFEAMDEALFLRSAELVRWLRESSPDNRTTSEQELLEFLFDNYRALRYAGDDRLPAAPNASTWIQDRLFWYPGAILLRGKLIERSVDDEDYDDDGSDEPMPAIEEGVLRTVFGTSKKGTLVVGSPESMERYKAISSPRKAWNWCLHCERAYPQGSYRQVRDLQMCPYHDCDGDTVMDLWTWTSVRRNNPGYPEAPEVGKHYPLYGATELLENETNSKLTFPIAVDSP